MLKSSIIIDELPTVFIKGLDNLIATARSNKVAVLLGFQDFPNLSVTTQTKKQKLLSTPWVIFSPARLSVKPPKPCPSVSGKFCRKDRV